MSGTDRRERGLSSQPAVTTDARGRPAMISRRPSPARLERDEVTSENTHARETHVPRTQYARTHTSDSVIYTELIPDHRHSKTFHYFRLVRHSLPDVFIFALSVTHTQKPVKICRRLDRARHIAPVFRRLRGCSRRPIAECSLLLQYIGLDSR